MVDKINEFWKWMGVTAESIAATNEFGNIVFISDKGQYWRICPEELQCEMIAPNDVIWEDVKEEQQFKKSWEMTEIVEAAKNTLGELNEGEKYCLKLPLILGGLFEERNFGKISQEALIRFSGEMAFQIKDMPDGEKIQFGF